MFTICFAYEYFKWNYKGPLNLHAKVQRSKKTKFNYLEVLWHFIALSTLRYVQILCIKYTACWHSLHSICRDLQSVAPEYLLPLCAGSVYLFTLMLLIAWKVCCGNKPACKSCIFNETCSRWAWALQSGLALIKYQLALLLYLISCHIHTLSGFVEEKLKWKLWPCSLIQFVALLGLNTLILTLRILNWFLLGAHKKKLQSCNESCTQYNFHWGRL